MATEIRVRRVLNRLVPADKLSEDELMAIDGSKEFDCKIWQKRNSDHHRKYFALVNAIFPHQKGWPTTKALHDQLKMAVGFSYEAKDMKTGEVRTYPDSIAFDRLDQQEFEQVYERIVEVILTRVLPGVGRRDLEAQVLDILNGRRAA
jgi:hypothetical protein